MDIDKLLDLYYGFVVGEMPDNDEDIIKTKLLFGYLSESGITEKQLISCIMNDFPNKDVLYPDDIPDNLWDNSLLKRHVFYFHKELQVLSPPPTWEESFPFYIEMKIQYTVEDVLKYFIKRFKLNDEWVNREKEIGSIKYLIKDYKKYQFIEPVDFLLHIIDFVASKDAKVISMYDLRDYEAEYLELLEIDINSSKAAKKNKVIWRMDVCVTGI